MKILVLGGTRFLGRHLVDQALARGDDVTVFTRGKQPNHWQGRVTALVGNRDQAVSPGLRAIEEGIPIIRATPTGISAVIDADGRLLATVPLRRAGAIDLPLPAAHPPTLFSRLGNWMTLITVAVMLLLAVAIRRAAR